MIAQFFSRCWRRYRSLCIKIASLALLLLGAGLLWLFFSPLPPPMPGKQALVVLTTASPLTFDEDDPDHFSGFEHDLTQAFARELGVEVKYQIDSPADVTGAPAAHRAHLSAAWLTPNPGESASAPYYESRDLLVQHEASLPLAQIEELAGKTVHVLSGSRQAKTLQVLRRNIPDLEIIEVDGIDAVELLEDIAERRIEYAAVDRAFFRVALQVAPGLQASLFLSPPLPISWLFPVNADPDFVASAKDFIDRFQKTADYARLRDRYFGYVERLDAANISAFIEASKTRLPKLRPLFHAAQTLSGIDWRLLAALAYQESMWDTEATSPTGVRGIMMLTADTADQLGVKNRLDPKESILAGARYLDQLRQSIPAATPEPDRTWLGMAAYNIGRGHLNAALQIARQKKISSDSWHEMRRVLPLLARPEYYSRLKSGRARGGEAVILVENVRSFYNILLRFEAPFKPLGHNGKRHHRISKRKSHRR